MKATEAGKAQMRAYRESHREELLAYWKAYRIANKEKIAEYKIANRDRISEREAAYRSTHIDERTTRRREWAIAHPGADSATQRRMKKLYPEKKHARDAVKNEVRSGRLPSPTTLTCACGSPAHEYHHHNGYEPGHEIDVIAICKRCHVSAHKETSHDNG